MNTPLPQMQQKIAAQASNIARKATDMLQGFKQKKQKNSSTNDAQK
ncbi:hypothetical protein KC711_00315 [Candidatus Peregrinibacteria bacterium]|nr:hypothetical protein [Candidatus Peregrinibacteria bacterium]MCB9804698.1 hypothetical protein [Candidatus Peribacteria bacterium]